MTILDMAVIVKRTLVLGDHRQTIAPCPIPDRMVLGLDRRSLLGMPSLAWDLLLRMQHLPVHGVAV
jgi:hypothetical protein